MALAKFGEEASAMLLRNDFSGLAEKFGYAVAFDRTPHAAIEADFLRAVASPNRENVVRAVTTEVTFYAPNDSGLVAAIECIVPISDDSTIELSLIVAGKVMKDLLLLRIFAVLNTKPNNAVNWIVYTLSVPAASY